MSMIFLYNIKHIQPLLSSHIGKLLSWKGDNYVYEYGDNKVIKFSKFYFHMGEKNAYIRANYDLTHTKKYFGEYMLDTQIVTIPKAHCIALVQQKITGRQMHISDMKSDVLKPQFIDILQRYENLRKETKQRLDLIGGDGLFGEYMSNIFVINEKKLCIIDVTLLSTKGFRYMTPFIYLLFTGAIYLQSIRIKTFMKNG